MGHHDPFAEEILMGNIFKAIITLVIHLGIFPKTL